MRAFKPRQDATISTVLRTPIFNAQGNLASPVDPTDIVIPAGAKTDKLTNQKVGLKERWLTGTLITDLAACYIDWRNIQVHANRMSDLIQFATKNVKVSAGVLRAKWMVTVFDDQSGTYVSPEAFLASRYGTSRPHTAGVRISYNL